MAEYQGCEHPVCMVPGCMSDVPKDPQYLRKRGVCLAHLRAHSVYIDGIWHRFCQQCGRFQPLSEFQDDRRSCEVALRAHNARRRVKCRGRHTQLPSTDARVEKKSGAKKGAAALKAAAAAAAAAAQHYPWADPRWAAAAAAAAAAGAYAASAPLAHSRSMPAGALNSSSMAGWAAGYSAGVEGIPAYAGVNPAGSALSCAPYAQVPGMEQYWLWQQQQGLWYPQQLQQSCAHPQNMRLLQQLQQLQPDAAMSSACMYPRSVFMSGAAMVHPHLEADAALARVYSAPASYLGPQCRQPAPMPANAPVAPPQHSTMQQQQASPDAGSNWDNDGPWAGDSEDLRAPLTPQHSTIESDDTQTFQGGAAEPVQHDDQGQQQQPVAQGRTAGAAAGTRGACAQQAQASAGAAAEMGSSCHQADSARHVAYARIAWPAPQRIDLAALLNMANQHATGFTAGQAPAQLLQALQQQRRQAGHQGAVDNAAGLQMPGAEAQALPGTLSPGAEQQASADLGGSPALQLQKGSPSAVLGCRHQLDAESVAGPAAGKMQGGEGVPAYAAAVRPGHVGDECAPPPAAFGGTAAAQQSSTQDSGVRSAEALDLSYADPAALAFLESIGAVPAVLQASGHSGAQLAAAGSALDQDLEVLLDDALDALLFDTTSSDQGDSSGCESGEWESQAGGHGCDDVSELVDV